MATVSDFLVERLKEWDIHRIYGYSGDGINGVIGALGRVADAPTFIQVRHEESAALMATAHAKFSGKVGVCLATSGPGAIHLLNGLYDAKLDHQPVVAIVGQQARPVLGGGFQQEMDLQGLFKDVAQDYVHTVTTPAQMRHLIDRALRIAIAERTVTCVIIPNDVQEMEAVQQPPHKRFMMHSGVGYTQPHIVPDKAELQRAADILNAGERVAMLVGAGALHATDEVIDVANRLGAGVAKALLGKSVLPDDLPCNTGTIGLLGTRPSSDMMANCDTLLMVGTGFPYGEFLPAEGQARGVQIDVKPRMLSVRYPMEVNLVGDSAETLRALLPYLEVKQDRGWREQIEQEVATWWNTLEARALTSANPINPQRVFWELSPRLPDNCILCADSGTAVSWFALDVKIRRGMQSSLSGKLATMGAGVPYAIAAKFAHPERVALALMGDGAMQMLGNSNLITIAKYWQEWSDPRLITLVLNNQDLNLVTWEQRATMGDPKFAASQNIPDFPYASYAESLGLKGIRVEQPDKLGTAWDEAFAADRPVVLEVLTDPNVPPLPPHITFEQAKSYTAALFKGDPDARNILLQSFKQAVADVMS
jgi:pyruvate dehydrogenase (quinone)